MDLDHTFGQDLSFSATGDLLLTSGTQEGAERVYRRLLTNPGDYIWNPQYGAGIRSWVGQRTNIPVMTSIIQSQIRNEAVVALTPLPVVTMTDNNTGIVTTRLVYTDSQTADSVTISTPLTGN